MSELLWFGFPLQVQLSGGLSSTTGLSSKASSPGLKYSFVRPTECRVYEDTLEMEPS